MHCRVRYLLDFDLKIRSGQVCICWFADVPNLEFWVSCNICYEIFFLCLHYTEKTITCWSNKKTLTNKTLILCFWGLLLLKMAFSAFSITARHVIISWREWVAYNLINSWFLMTNSILKIFGSVDVKITPDFCYLQYPVDWRMHMVFHDLSKKRNILERTR